MIEVLSQFVRIVSLSFRLFFNMLAGHLVIAVFLGLAVAARHVLHPADRHPHGRRPLPARGTLIAGLQAFIFATLSAIYIGGAIHPDH